ncbi:MAG: TonB-dependent receptor plug domain-containing protein [Burkholderiaceae bacterium]|nr:TonB-dependent receptor plug domain-containing protein [Burkholderiaceae bacterium]
MKFRLNCIAALCAVLPVAGLAQDDKTMETVTVTQPRMLSPGETAIGESTLAPMRAATSDTARLLLDVPGVSLYGAGGVSSLPAIHGLADDRLRIQVDGMDLMAACPNHMNSALSYIDPSRVASITVFAGITPVSVGGDSIGGTIQVKSAPPRFADSAEQSQASGQVGAFYRSNGNASGFNLGAEYVAPNLYLSYSGSLARSDNYSAGGDFKAAGPGTVGGPWLTGSEVGSSNYNARNHDIGLAWRHDQHLLQLNVSQQNIPFEGFPNQRMDMTANDSTQVNLRYTGKFGWGQLMVRGYDQNTDHEMNMGPDRFSYGAQGMPMNTQARTRGGLVQADVALTDQDILRFGLEAQTYTLYDWWPPVGGVMGPNTFWNIDYGTRNRAGVFGEWEAQWSEQWLSQIGVRGEVVKTDAGPVQGYNAQPIWSVDAAAFNAAYRPRTDHNLDVTALTRYTPDAKQQYEAGFARKSRSPNLYQRYVWSTQPMAMLMNNFVGDGNGYVGNLDLKPEVAYTVSASGDWHDTVQKDWRVKATGYFTYVQDYIDAQRCNFGQCGGTANLTATTGFVNLQYVNQSARLYGVDLSGSLQLGQSADYGSFKGSGLLSYVRGKNPTTGGDLYNIMPLNAKVAVTQNLGGWSNTAEVQLVAAKVDVSQVRNEVPTAGYGLLNLRSSYEWKQLRLDFGIENVLNRLYAMPLGGAYLGQGASMTSRGIPWGVVVPGMGRSFNLALTVRI